MRVVLFDRADDAARAMATELGAVAVVGDSTDDDDVAASVGAATKLGSLSLLVNVAGGGLGGGRTLARDGTPHDKQSFVDTMEMNAVGTFNMTRVAAATMAANEPDADGHAASS